MEEQKSFSYIVTALRDLTLEWLGENKIKFIYPSSGIQTAFLPELSNLNLNILKMYPDLNLDYIHEFKQVEFDPNAPKLMTERDILNGMIIKNPVLGDLIQKFDFRLP